MTSLSELEPLARQNISIAYQLSHYLDGNDSKDSTNNVVTTASQLWSFLLQEGFDLSKDFLRVDCFPKNLTESICLGLQKAAAAPGSTIPSSPFEGPLQMTKSASNCTHALHVLYDNESQSFWIGLCLSQSYQETVCILNDYAAKELALQPTDERTGQDLYTNASPEAPVSRAYYKLQQVWNDVLRHLFMAESNTSANAIDLGASPGGWTQVLKKHGRFGHVVAVDPGLLAHRVAALEGVEHIRADFCSQEFATALLQMNTCLPLSLLVCDASIDSNRLLTKLTTMAKNLSGNNCWTLPCVWVLTFKLPYRSISSIEKNVTKLVQAVPQQLQEVTGVLACDYGREVDVKFQVLHLFANQCGERTIVAVFE
jgi:23S rRNA U2552 (ribose-2'-O)-methylase RlmE/FtsJ